MSQVWQALERGDLYNGPIQEPDGSVSGVFQVLTAGLPVFVTVCIVPEGNQVVVRYVEEG